MNLKGFAPPYARAAPAAKRLLILTAVGVYFASGLISLIPTKSKVFGLPVFNSIVSLAVQLHGRQAWFMFAPPPQERDGLAYSGQFSSGWTEPEPLTETLRKSMVTSVIIPRGAERIWLHFTARDIDFDIEKLSNNHKRQLYFQQLSDHFCRGSGEIPGLKKIRFHAVRRGWKRFFSQGNDGSPEPDTADFDQEIAIYEQSCDA